MQDLRDLQADIDRVKRKSESIVTTQITALTAQVRSVAENLQASEKVIRTVSQLRRQDGRTPKDRKNDDEVKQIQSVQQNAKALEENNRSQKSTLKLLERLTLQLLSEIRRAIN